jgi:hypothetical protein
MELQPTLQQIASRYNYKLDESSLGVFRMDVTIPLKEQGKFRFQLVYIWITKEASGRERIYMNSRCGVFTPQLNLYNILKESAYGNYSTVTITTDKTPEGTPCETVIVQAVPALSMTTPELLNEIIYEVAVSADIIEEKFFGGDKF